MVEHTRASIAFLIIPLLGGPALAAQRQAYQYPVKYVCGNRLSCSQFDVSVEDPGRGQTPDRIQQTTLSGLAASAVVSVTLDFPYPMSGSNSMAALVGTVDPKNAIPECREDNNSRTLGAIP